MNNWQERTSLLFGEEKMRRIREAHVLVVGVGGVGAYAAEMLCRAGVGELTIVDGDCIQPSNINRQLPALQTTIGQQKVVLLKERFEQINPSVQVNSYPVFLKDEAIGELLDNGKYDFVIDAIDTLSPKCFLIAETIKRNIPIISSMGAGAKVDISQVQFGVIWKTQNCNLSKAVRKRLKKMGISYKLPVVFSTEQAHKEAIILIDDEKNKVSTCGTVSYMPATFGCYLSQYVLTRL